MVIGSVLSPSVLLLLKDDGEKVLQRNKSMSRLGHDGLPEHETMN